jgi:phosphoglucosamine mutase
VASIRFGTDGIRGPAGTPPIVPEVARRIGRAAVKLAAGTGVRVLVARDPRPSGADLADAVGRGVIDAGGIAADAGIVPTAAVQIAIAAGLADVGVMVTASHNPAEDNGFKVLGAGGRKLDDGESARVEAWLDAPPVPARTGNVRTVSDEVRAEWRRRLALATGDLSPLAGRRIAIDCANGALSEVRELVTDLVPAEIVWLGTAGPINDGCGSEHLAHLSTRVRERGCQGGFAVDGDADRCRVVDELGREVPGDAVTWRLAVDRSASGLAVTVMSNGALERQLPGVRIVRTPVGDRFLREAMDRDRLPLGAEESGHVLFADHPGGDGLLCGLRALSAAFRASPTLSDAFASFVPLPRKLTKLVVKSRPPLEGVVPVQRARTVGLERLGPFGRVFLRYSGTEPVLRILVEGEPATVVDAVSAAVTSAAARALA